MDGPVKEKVTPVAVKAPVNLKDRPEYSYYSREVLTYSVIVYEHHDVYIAHSGVCFNRFGQLVPGSFMQLKRVKKDQQKIALFNLLFRKKKRLDRQKIYLVIHNQWSINGYYHWVIDSMPRLWSVKDRLGDLCLLLPESARENNFIQGTLQFFPDLTIEYLETDKVAYAKSLVLPSHLPYWGILEPVYLHEFRKRVLEKIVADEQHDFIYVSRERASRRKVDNEKEVTEELREFGFQIVYLEDYEFDRQVKIFQSAKIVVSIHGAGLTNLIFMNRHASVLELIKRPGKEEKYLMEYQRLASMFGLNFYSLPSEPVNSSASFDEANLIINVHELRELINNIIAIQGYDL